MIRVSNFWTRKTKAEQEYESLKRQIEEFFSQSASGIKRMSNPSVAETSYNKRNFQDDIEDAHKLSSEEIKQCEDTIKSEVKNAPEVVFPSIDYQALQNKTNDILRKSVIERVRIKRLEDNVEKREFAKKGLSLHSKGDVCAFCGSEIKEATFDELGNYFSADEVKAFQEEIREQNNELLEKKEQLMRVNIECDKFYPTLLSSIDELSKEFDDKRKEISLKIDRLREALDEKSKYLFETCSALEDDYADNLDYIEKRYKELKDINNNNDISEKKKEAAEKLRLHYVNEYLEKFAYNSIKAKLSVLEATRDQRTDEFNAEERKITADGGLKGIINNINKDIIALQNSTKNETLLAENINNKLRHMVSFELVHVEDDESKGFYRVRSSATGIEREITKLSTGEKNIIAFLYFIEKLNEIKDSAQSKPRIIVFDDPMCSNDDGMQYLIIEELERLMKKVPDTDKFILLTHNKHFYLNVKYSRSHRKDRFIRFQSDGHITHFENIDSEDDDYKTSYGSLWTELKFLYNMETVSADLLLNPMRRIIETFTGFNALDKRDYCNQVDGAMKLFNVNSHSIDDVEAELNGKTKEEIIQIFFDCFSRNNNEEHFRRYWSELEIGESGRIIFPN